MRTNILLVPLNCGIVVGFICQNVNFPSLAIEEANKNKSNNFTKGIREK